VAREQIPDVQKPAGLATGRAITNGGDRLAAVEETT
jgi:hypothetical protein